MIREALELPGLGRIPCSPVTYKSGVGTERDKIMTILAVDRTDIRFELVREARITFEVSSEHILGVRVLNRVEPYTEKLLANASHGQDRSVKRRDIIGLAMMIRAWGDIPALALEKTIGAYGPSDCVLTKKAAGTRRCDPCHARSARAQRRDPFPIISAWPGVNAAQGSRFSTRLLVRFPLRMSVFDERRTIVHGAFEPQGWVGRRLGL